VENILQRNEIRQIIKNIAPNIGYIRQQ